MKKSLTFDENINRIKFIKNIQFNHETDLPIDNKEIILSKIKNQQLMKIYMTLENDETNLAYKLISNFLQKEKNLNNINYSIAYFIKAITENELKNYYLANEFYQLSIIQNPSQLNVFYFGINLANQKFYKEAILCFDKIIDYNIELILRNKVDVKEENGKRIITVRHKITNEVIDYKTNLLKAFNCKAHCLSMLNKQPEAIELLNRCIELEPDNLLYKENKSAALFYSGRLFEAIKIYQSIISSRNANEHIWEAMFNCYQEFYNKQISNLPYYYKEMLSKFLKNMVSRPTSLLYTGSIKFIKNELLDLNNKDLNFINMFILEVAIYRFPKNTKLKKLYIDLIEIFPTLNVELAEKVKNDLEEYNKSKLLFNNPGKIERHY